MSRQINLPRSDDLLQLLQPSVRLLPVQTSGWVVVEGREGCREEGRRGKGVGGIEMRK